MEKSPRGQGSSATHPPPGQQSPVMGIPVVSPTNNRQLPSENWSTGLCDCCSDCKSCCLVCWCPCIAFGRLSEIVDKGTSSCGCNGSLYFALCLLGGLGSGLGLPLGFQWIYSCTYRSKMKHDFNIPASCCEEFCVHCCCEPCALCQEYRELQIRGYDVSLGWNGNMANRRQGRSNMTPSMEGVAEAPVAPSMAR